MTACFVIAHYKENLDWLGALPSQLVHIHSKGGHPLSECYSHYKTSYLPNVGREAHTYLHYIIENYDKLPDVVFFSQGMDDHYSAKHMMMSVQVLLNDPKERILGGRFSYVPGDIERHFNIYHWNGDQLTRVGKTFGEWFREAIDPEFPDILYLFWAACFAVKKERILSRPREFYEGLIKHVDGSRNPEAAHFFERAWFYVFNCHKA